MMGAVFRPGFPVLALCLAMLAGLAAGCATPKYEVSVPPAASEILDVRRDQYNEAMRRYSYGDRAESEPVASPPPVVSPRPAPVVDAPPPSQGIEGRRMALVIGNARYAHGNRLANPANDAGDMAAALRRLGFDVTLVLDADQDDMRRAIDAFGDRLGEGDTSLFYYAGHGIQVSGNNYLIPVDANLKSEGDVEYNGVHAGRILAKMEDAGCRTNIVIFDACRDNPFARSWTRGIRRKNQGLASMLAPSGSLIAYSTAPGTTASDGRGKNSVYTAALLRHIRTPNIPIEKMFKQIRMAVREGTNGVQVPWESTSLTGDFYFKVRR